MNNHLTIAIDGPAGAGKSTIAKKIAAHYGVTYVDTGAMYRAVALHMMSRNISVTKEEQVVEAMGDIEISLEYKEGSQIIILNGEDVSIAIRQQEVGENASVISAYLPVRQQMVAMQQEMATKSSLVMDGRDIGTHVLKDASLKVYLSADVLVRAKRRYDQLVKQGVAADLGAIAEEIRDRDYRDMNREHSPLEPAEDAILVDTSYMDIETSVNTIIQLVERS